MKTEDQRKPLSMRAQFLINELISCARATSSEFPMKALKAQQRVDSLKEELQEHIRDSEQPK